MLNPPTQNANSKINRGKAEVTCLQHWTVYEAFAQPGGICRQLAEMSDGGAYLWIARTVVGQCGGFEGPHPEREYLLRKNENVRFAEKQGVPFIDADYDKDNWFARAKGMEWDPERGVRCTMCFDMRFERTALYAHEHGFPVMTSSLGVSRWKNMAQINDCGMRAVAPYEGLAYWDFNWRKGGGSSWMIEISKREEFYQQEYCGCVYSLRDSNVHRRSQGREPIEIGKLYYSNAERDNDASG